MFPNTMLKEKGILSSFIPEAEALQCSSLKMLCEKQVTSSVRLRKK